MGRYTIDLCAQLEDFSETHFRFSRKANVLDRGVALFTELEAEVASVLADALNVHEATGLTPSQLQARVAELEATLRGICAYVDDCLSSAKGSSALDDKMIDRALHGVRQTKP